MVGVVVRGEVIHSQVELVVVQYTEVGVVVVVVGLP
jgi:hypothetical protein